MTTAIDCAARLEFDSWARDHRTCLFRMAVAITRDRHEAEDLLQTTLTKVYLAWDRVRDQDALDAYVRRVMVNTHSSWWRRNRRRQEIPSGSDVGVELASGADDFAALAARDELAPLLRALPPRQQSAVVLRYLHDRSVAETAALLGISVGAVKSQTCRGIASMRRLRSLHPAA